MEQLEGKRVIAVHEIVECTIVVQKRHFDLAQLIFRVNPLEIVADEVVERHEAGRHVQDDLGENVVRVVGVRRAQRRQCVDLHVDVVFAEKFDDSRGSGGCGRCHIDSGKRVKSQIEPNGRSVGRAGARGHRKLKRWPTGSRNCDQRRVGVERNGVYGAVLRHEQRLDRCGQSGPSVTARRNGEGARFAIRRINDIKLIVGRVDHLLRVGHFGGQKTNLPDTEERREGDFVCGRTGVVTERGRGCSRIDNADWWRHSSCFGRRGLSVHKARRCSDRRDGPGTLAQRTITAINTQHTALQIGLETRNIDK